MSDDIGEIRSRVAEYAEEIMHVLREHGPEIDDAAAFGCALSAVLGSLLARTAVAADRPLGPLIKLAVETMEASAWRQHDADRRERMQ
jgi:hypothetical protein